MTIDECVKRLGVLRSSVEGGTSAKTIAVFVIAAVLSLLIGGAVILARRRESLRARANEPRKPEANKPVETVPDSRPLRLALVTFFISTALGRLAARQWGHAALCFFIEIGLLLVGIASVLGRQPVFIVVATGCAWLWRLALAIDAYRLARAGLASASLKTRRLQAVGLFVVLVAIETTVRARFFEPFHIPSASMAPTLVVGDFIMINKRVRSFRRGDLIVFRSLQDPSVSFVKRIVAIGGDSVEFTGDVPIVNGSAARHEPVDRPCVPGSFERECEVWRESLSGVEYEIQKNPFRPRNDLSVAVPPETVFVVGDNRDQSADSRMYGPIPVENIIGSPLIIWWSFGSEGAHWRRVGTRLH